MIHFTSPAGWLPVHRDQLRAQRSVTSMEKLYLYLYRYFTNSECLLEGPKLLLGLRHWFLCIFTNSKVQERYLPIIRGEGTLFPCVPSHFNHRFTVRPKRLILWFVFLHIDTSHASIVPDSLAIDCSRPLQCSRLDREFAPSRFRTWYAKHTATFRRRRQKMESHCFFPIYTRRQGPDLQNTLRHSCDNGKLTIDLRRTSNLSNILRKTQG